MTGTSCAKTSHSLSRSYLNHLVHWSSAFCLKDIELWWGKASRNSHISSDIAGFLIIFHHKYTALKPCDFVFTAFGC
jgi:hypothetical protein